MDRKLIAEVLAAHADRLVQGQRTKAREILSVFSDDQNLEPLLEVAEEVKDTMAPVKPPPEFRRDLETKLLAEAQEALATEKPTPSMGRSVILIILAGLGSLILSIVGLILFFFRGRKPKPRRSQSSSRASS
ncbi:MAG: hypothetical protein HYX86_06325 [Chloroflexi bacterium]|nr:hypothetical protein [Chloroflexota bacterium]